ncbi:hypothetical protein RND81_13G118600 [Saponaria officinalis]|uniref:Cation/H+ exchanger domain-containing protein n=1 Tax=Saponaria officinalis TaxID=3572 RepID=A0AAW1GZY5_SAPOF
MGSTIERVESNDLWRHESWGNYTILCQDDVQPRRGYNGLFSNSDYINNSTTTLCLFQFGLILMVISIASYVLKPLRLPILSQMAGGVIIMGLLFPFEGTKSNHPLLPDPVLYTLTSLSYFGFSLHSFMLGVETNMGALKRIGKKSITICFGSFGASFGISYLAYNYLRPGNTLQGGAFRLILLQAQTFFAVTCTNVNNLGISNSELGRLACAIALIIDVFGMFLTFIIFNLIFALLSGDWPQPLLVLGDYILLFFVLRPILLRIVSYTPEGERMKQSHFMAVIFIVIIAALAGSLVDQYFSVYLFALSIPEEPLSSILAEKLDTITSGFLFPVLCAIHGFQANFGVLKNVKRASSIELVLLAGQAGKFIGTFLFSTFFAIPWQSSVSLGIIISSKGFFDIIVTCLWKQRNLLTVDEYTIAALHFLIYTGALLPLVRFLYEPSEQYTTIFRQNVLASSLTGGLQTLACIYKEDNLPPLLNLFEALNPSRVKPVSIVTLQLIQLTGRCSLPIMAPFYQVKSYAALRSNVARCTRIVNGFTNHERKFRGFTRLQHYISVASYATMHNDICNLAFEKDTSLLILPFHVKWTEEGSIEYTSNSIRDVNKMVFEKAPCSVGLLLSKGERNLTQIQLHQPKEDMYRITGFFIGGADDHEVVAYCILFASHPCVKVTLIWLNSRNRAVITEDYEVIDKCIKENGTSVTIEEVVCNDGSETTEIIKSMKDEIDMAIVGMHHDSGIGPMEGLAGAWNEYPELGVLGDFVSAPIFNFSVLVVQQEPQKKEDTIAEDEFGIFAD